MNCEFCNKYYSSKSNLNYHQKTAKFCLKLQEEYENEIIDQENIKEEKFICEFCGAKFNRKNNLRKHLSTCKDKDDVLIRRELEMKIVQLEKTIIDTKENYEKIIADLKLQNENLQDRMERLFEKAIEKPSTTTNKITSKSDNSVNTYNHLQPINLTPEYLYQVLDKNLRIEDIYQGQIGLANVIANKLLTDENGSPLAFCNDKARQIIKYKNHVGEMVKDVKAYNLVSSIAPVAEKIAIKRKNEFENAINGNGKEVKEEKKEIKKKKKKIQKFDEGFIDANGDFFGFEDEIIEIEVTDDEEEEFDKEITMIRKENNEEKKKEIVENILRNIEAHSDWDEDKKTYYLQKLVKGITDLRILNVNPTLFSKQLSMILPSETKILEVE